MTAYEYRMRAEEQHADHAAQRAAYMAIMYVGTAAMFVEPAVILLGLGLVAGIGIMFSRPRTVNALLWAGLGCLGWYTVLYPLWHPLSALIPLIPPIEQHNGVPLPMSVPPPLWMQAWVWDRGALGIAAVYASSLSKGLLDFFLGLWRVRP